ncbi:hypothetical protein PVK06_023590 [Gossypium arboreum]|uniref:Aminotransferase-like plant mobile domain-containing protein n=1 Tax=Gossypium arboreum TaxID=29729 RepID=A0ABR0PBK6_GOSAR|nr:hypothetical protein PVK06_023590 [Gossypium arboreum]
MAGEIIRLNNKHISVDQMTMSVDRVLQCYICNMFGPPSPLIENYLREGGFWHVAMIGQGECTITLEDVHLQLGLSVDGYTVTGSTSSTDWRAVCYELLGVIPDNINEGRIEMGWLRDTFPEPDNDSTELERIRYARAYILEMIGGYLMTNLSRNLVHLRWLLKLIDFRAASELSWGSAVLASNIVQGNVRGDATEQSQNKRLPITTAIMGTVSLSIFMSSSGPPIYISTHNEFQWTPYEDQKIWAVILDEFLQNPNV